MQKARHATVTGAALAAAVLALTPLQTAGAQPSTQLQQPSHSGAAAPSSQTLGAQPNRAATMNVFNPGGRKPITAAGVLATYRPQVVGLQEVCDVDVGTIRDELSRRTGIKYYAVTARFMRWWDFRHNTRCGLTGGYSGIGILSASPITDSGSHTYDEGGSERRGYQWANTLVDGVEVRVFNTHLAQAGQASERRSQVSELVGEAGLHGRALVLGDFNAEPHFGELSSMWDVFTEADPGCRRVYSPTCTVTANASPRRKKFDYVWINSAFKPGPGVTAVDTWSDHDFVFSDVKNIL